MAIRTELSLRLPNTAGALDRVCQALADERVNLLAFALGAGGTLRMLVDNPLHAAATLREQHYRVDERDVLFTTVPNEPGALSRIIRVIGEAGVNLDYAYGSCIESGPMAGVVIGVADVQAASALSGI
ncbi:MAG TPA: ACT domain-containing protein [Coriobacteriia bacterium]